MRSLANRLSAFFLVLAFALSAAGCASKAAFSDVSAPVGERAQQAEFEAARPDRMLVWRASMKLEVKDVEDAAGKADSAVRQAGGHVDDSNVNAPERATLRIRVPADRLNATLDTLAALGAEKNRSVSSQDVTESMIDMEARLKNAIALRDRLRTLLDRAKDVKDVLDIERELVRVQSEIDSMDGRLKNLRSQVQYATVSLYLERKTILGPLGYIGNGIMWVMEKLFVIQ